MKPKQLNTATLHRLDVHLRQATNILCITHQRLDHDAITSVLLVRHILDTYYQKNASVIIQDTLSSLLLDTPLPTVASATTVDPESIIDTRKYDCIVMVDTPSIARCIRSNETVEELYARTIVFDHHTTTPPHKTLFTINQQRSSAAEEVFATFFELIPNLTNDTTASTLTQIGILADTNRFMYSGSLSRETFQLFGMLYESSPINIEKVYYSTIQSTRHSLSVLKHIIDNMVLYDSFFYTYIDPTFLEKNTLTAEDEEAARTMFLVVHARSIPGINWGCLIRKLDGNNEWNVSFRAIHGTKNVLALARKLGGGGHTYAAGATFSANNLDDAIQQVRTVIKN